MAVGPVTPATSALGIGGVGGALNRGQSDQGAEPPLGIRSAVSLSSGLRAGIDLVQGADETLAEISEAREQAQESAREAAAEEARKGEFERAAAELGLTAGEDGDEAAATGDGEDDASQAVQAAVLAGQQGEAPTRGSFIDLTI